MRKRTIIILIVFGVFFNFIGCSKEKNNEVKGADKLEMLKVNIPHSLKLSTSVAITSKGIENLYGKADRVRTLKIKTYEIRNIKDGSKLFVIYDNEANRVIDMWQLNKLYSRENFKTIIEGKSIMKDIVEIDPYTTITEKSKDNGVSEHKLKNNEVLTINYIKKNDVWIVDKINFSSYDPSEFTKTLIEEDLELIS